MNIEFPLLIIGPGNSYKTTIALKVAFESALKKTDKPTNIILYSSEIDNIEVIKSIFENKLKALIPQGFYESTAANNITFDINASVEVIEDNRKHTIVIIDELSEFIYSLTPTPEDNLNRHLEILNKSKEFLKLFADNYIKNKADLILTKWAYGKPCSFEKQCSNEVSGVMLPVACPMIIRTNELRSIKDINDICLSSLIVCS